MSRRVLVTGGAGFIGSHLVDRLVQSGEQVIVIDNESTGSATSVKSRVSEYLRCDVSHVKDVQRAFSHRPEVVLHIAGQASTFKSFDNPEDDLRTNVQGTLNVLKACMEFGVQRLLYASSMVVYGHPAALPISEDAAASPISYYGVTKYAAERYVHATAERTDLGFPFHVTSFRMFNVYGEGQSLTNPYQGVMGIFIGNVLRGEPITIFGDGEQTRDFIYIQDVVDAWIAAIDNPQAYGQVFNLGSGTRRSINDLAHLVITSLRQAPGNHGVVYAVPRPGDQRHMEADISKARTILGWAPKTSFEEGLKRTIAWATQNRP